MENRKRNIYPPGSAHGSLYLGAARACRSTGNDRRQMGVGVNALSLSASKPAAYARRPTRCQRVCVTGFPPLDLLATVTKVKVLQVQEKDLDGILGRR